VLVAYASFTGSTVYVAEVIAQVLTQAGYSVDMFRMQDIRLLAPYSAAVLGTSIRLGKPLPEAMDFVRTHRAALRHLQIAVFTTSITMRENTPEGRAKILGYMAPFLNEINEPLSVGFIPGMLDSNNLSLYWRIRAPRDESGQIPEGDWRNRREIQAWASDVADRLLAPNA
jgi:menaquinone-dependent protoporphyrinogen oxidase